MYYYFDKNSYSWLTHTARDAQTQLLYIFGTLVGIVPPFPSFTPAHDAHWDERTKINSYHVIYTVSCKVRPDNHEAMLTI